MILYIVRHGQTDWNLAHRFQGSQNLQLNSTGQKQAEQLAERLRTIPFDAVYSSPLDRAQQTARAIAAAQGIGSEKILLDQRVREYSFGAWEGVQIDEVQTQQKALWDTYRHRPSAFQIEGSENFNERYRQMQEFYKDLIRYDGKKRNVLLVCHGIALSILLCAIFDLSVDKCMMFAGKNASVSIVNFERDYPRLTLFNDVSHYEEL